MNSVYLLEDMLGRDLTLYVLREFMRPKRAFDFFGLYGIRKVVFEDGDDEMVVVGKAHVRKYIVNGDVYTVSYHFNNKDTCRVCISDNEDELIRYKELACEPMVEERWVFDHCETWVIDWFKNEVVIDDDYWHGVGQDYYESD